MEMESSVTGAWSLEEGARVGAGEGPGNRRLPLCGDSEEVKCQDWPGLGGLW